MKELITGNLNSVSDNQVGSIATAEGVPFLSKKPVLDDFLWNGFEPIFYSHHKLELNLPPKNFVEKQELDGTVSFLSYFIIALVWSFLYRKNEKDFTGIVKSFVSNNSLMQEFEDSKSSNGVVSITLFVTGLVILAIYFSQVIEWYSPKVNLGVFGQSVSSVLLIGMVLVFGLLIKTLVVGIASLVFSAPKILGTYLSLNVISTQMLGILLFPIIVILSFGIELNPRWVLGMGGVMLTLTFLYRLSRTFFLGVKQTNSQVFHIILYICALEILPLMAIGRVFLDSQVQ